MFMQRLNFKCRLWTLKLKTLVEYLVHCNDMYLGLSAKETRSLAFDLVKKLNLKVPASWEAARMAGED